MAKKKERKAPAVPRSGLTLRGTGTEIQLTESYRLVKNRLNDIFKFIEVSVVKGTKLTFHKDEIKAVRPLS